MKACKMKTTLFLMTTILLFWGGCQSIPHSSSPGFETFNIQKISTTGIETVTLTSTKSEWPDMEYSKAAPFLFNSKDLHIAVIGDTGCRLKESNGKVSYQNCSLTKEWPYPEVSRSLVGESYDFAIHTGDYHYREQCTDAKLCPVYAAHTGYGWGTWWDDFFAPSLALFKKSPWLFVRGNHEDCLRAYQGWSFLSPVSKGVQRACEEIENYQWIEMDDLVFINFDNSSFEDRQNLQPAEVEKWKAQFVRLSSQIKSLSTKKEIWFLAHKPLLAFVPSPVDAEPTSIKPSLFNLMKETGVYDQIDFFLSGHIHNQQIIPSEGKVQLVVGHGGSALDAFGRRIMTDSLTTTTENKYSFGYALLHRVGFKTWDFIFKNQYGVQQLECHYGKNKINCD